jgi:hypothetical protein
MRTTCSRLILPVTLLASLAAASACSDAVEDGAPAAPPAADPGAEKQSPEARFEDTMAPAVLAAMRAQEALRPAMRALQDEIEAGQYPGATSAGYDDDGGLFLYWKGDLPPRMQAAVATAEKLAPVHVRAARYSRAELNAQAERVAEVMRAHPELGLQSVVALGDGSGLRVEVRARGAAAKPGLPAFAPGLPALDVPVTAVTAAPFELLSCPSGGCTRTDDTSPWNGGGWISNPGRMRCTSGFGVRNTSTGGQYLITAAHCATPPDHLEDAAGEYIGESTREFWRHDLILIAAYAMPWIWDGTANTSNHKAVSGWGWATPGELVCLSGSTSGIICGLKTQNDWSPQACGYDSDGDYGCYTDLINTKQIDGQVGGRHGDSGGPVFVLDGARVQARGTVSGGGGSTLLYQDFATAVRDYGNVTVLTGW